MLQSTAHTLERQQALNNDFQKSASSSINLVANVSSSAGSGIFLTVPQNAIINDTDYSTGCLGTNSVSILDTCQGNKHYNIDV